VKSAFIATTFLFVGFWGLAAAMAAESQRHLFLDPAAIAQAENASLHVNPPQPAEIVIRADRPWEALMISLFLTVRDEGRKLRMWYICRDGDNRANVAYAESEDGICWRKPNLGIVDYHGSTDNNLVGLSSLEGVVFRDPKGTPEEQYVYVTNLSRHGIVRHHSPDGLHWQRDPGAILTFRADTQNVTFWDEQLGQYVLYLRGWDVAEDWQGRLRKVVRLTLDSLSKPAGIRPSGRGDDPRHPSLPRISDEIPTVLRADHRDPENSDVYNISAQPYPPDPRWYVGFPSFLLREGGISDGRLEVQFAGSRDGIAWHRYDRRPYVAPGFQGSESGGMAFMGTGLAVRGDEIWQYGTCFRTRHGDVKSRQRRTDGMIRRYVQRLDGFVSLDFDLEGGRCLTAPVKPDGPGLLLNVDTGVLGELRVGLLDPGGKPIPGFAVEQCDAIRANVTRAAVSWQGRNDVSALQGRPVQLLFHGRRAKLFSFSFAAPRGPGRVGLEERGGTPRL